MKSQWLVIYFKIESVSKDNSDTLHCAESAATYSHSRTEPTTSELCRSESQLKIW